MSLFRFCFRRNVFVFRSSVGVGCFSREISSKQTKKLDLRGIFPPITTPFTSKGSIDFENLTKNMKRWNEIPFKATAVTIELTRKMASAGANCALVITPSFYKGAMSNASFKTHFLKIADESPIPILLYNVPVNTGLDLDPNVILELADHPNIVGLKDSGGDISKIGNLVFATKNKDFQILAGSAGFLYPALMMGCVGGICALANAMGKELCDLHLLYEQGKHDEALELQQKLIAPNTAVTRKYGVAGLKQAMEWFGFHGGPPRLPMLPLNREQITELKKEFTTRGFKV